MMSTTMLAEDLSEFIIFNQVIDPYDHIEKIRASHDVYGWMGDWTNNISTVGHSFDVTAFLSSHNSISINEWLIHLARSLDEMYYQGLGPIDALISLGDNRASGYAPFFPEIDD